MTEEYLNTFSLSNLMNWSCILFAMKYAKSYLVAGGCPGVRIDNNTGVKWSTYSLVLKPLQRISYSR